MWERLYYVDIEQSIFCKTLDNECKTNEYSDLFSIDKLKMKVENMFRLCII